MGNCFSTSREYVGRGTTRATALLALICRLNARGHKLFQQNHHHALTLRRITVGDDFYLIKGGHKNSFETGPGGKRRMRIRAYIEVDQTTLNVVWLTSAKGGDNNLWVCGCQIEGRDYRGYGLNQYGALYNLLIEWARNGRTSLVPILLSNKPRELDISSKTDIVYTVDEKTSYEVVFESENKTFYAARLRELS